MSPRAACRLERLGFAEVYDYVGGKADWLAAGLPTEGPGSARPRAGALARREIAICLPDETVSVARERAAASAWDHCVVVTGAGVVLGVLDEAALVRAADVAAESAMLLGPSTARADEDLDGLRQRIRARGAAAVLVTDPDGHLLGALVATDLDSGQTPKP